MAIPKLQLLSRTQYDTDGTTTVWDFNFSGGYILQDHVKAYYDSVGGVRTQVVVTPAMLIGTWQLQITPAIPAGNVLTIYRATPKDQPMVDFTDRGSISEVALDTLARQAVFVAAEASDDTVTANSDVAVNAAVQAQAAQAAASTSASTAAGSAASASTSAATAVTKAAEALGSATDAAASVASLADLQGSTVVGRAVLKAVDQAAARAAIGAGTGDAQAGANSNITSLTGLTSPIPRANTLSKIESLPNPTLSANAMTLPASTHALDFRSATLSDGLPVTVTGTAAALTIPAGATLGTVNAQQSMIVEVILNNAGTLEKAVVNIAGGNDLSETGVISTTAISAGSTAANVFYSNTARTGVAYKVIRTITSTQTTAGQWATNPSLVQGAGGNALNTLQSLGYGQTWQNVTGSRVGYTTYYNTTGRPIFVSIYSSITSDQNMSITVSGLLVARQANGNYSGSGSACTAIVPSGASYSASSISLGGWFELR